MSVITVIPAAEANANAPMSRPPSPKLGNELAAVFELLFESSVAADDSEKVADNQALVRRPSSPGPPSRVPTPVTAIRSPPEVTYNHGFFNGLHLDGFNVANPTAPTAPTALVAPVAASAPTAKKIRPAIRSKKRLEVTPAIPPAIPPTILPSTLPITPQLSEDEGASAGQGRINLENNFSNSTTLSPPAFPDTPDIFSNPASPMLPQKVSGIVKFTDAAGNIPSSVCIAIKGRGPYGPALIGTIIVPNSELIEPLLNAHFYSFQPQVVDPNAICPTYLATKEDKRLVLEAKLYHQYKLDAANDAPAAKLPIHMFVDLSNITIGFYERLKLNRGIKGRVRAPPFSFELFSRILERGRTVAVKTVAGSVFDSTDRNQWPVHMTEAEAAGWDMNILSRVTRTQPQSNKRRRGKNGRNGNSANRGHDYTTSEPTSSADDAVFSPGYARQGEQAVDEILHLKICNSILDHQPSTMLLATGDAAEAEFSDGFLKHAERALDRGWCVELYTWSKNISYAWKHLQRSRKYGDRFRVIDLDDFAEELLNILLSN